MKNSFLKIKICLILLLILGASTSFLSIIAEGISGSTVVLEAGKNRGVTVLSLDQSDPTVAVCASDMEVLLDSYVDVDKDTIVSLDDLDSSLTFNQDEFVVLIGHSGQDGITINNKLVGWDAISTIAEENLDKTFIIPTCYSSCLEEFSSSDNILTPFAGEVDFRISVDFTMLSIGYLLEDYILMDKGIDKLWDDISYFLQPESALIYVYESINEPGGTITYGVNLFAMEIALNAFIVKASAGAAFGAIAMKYLLKKTPGVGISFLSSLCSTVANWALYLVFISSMGWIHTYASMKDLGTTGYMQMEYIDTWIGRLTFYFVYHTWTKYYIYSPIYRRGDGAMVQDTYKVQLELSLVQSMTLYVNDLLSPSLLWDMQLVYWKVLSHTVTVHSPPPPPPELPPPGGGGGDIYDTID